MIKMIPLATSKCKPMMSELYHSMTFKADCVQFLLTTVYLCKNDMKGDFVLLTDKQPLLRCNVTVLTPEKKIRFVPKLVSSYFS